LRDLSVYKVLVLLFALLQAGPSNCEGLLFFTGLASDHRLHFRVQLDDASKQRALVEVIKDRRQQETSHGIAHSVGLRRFKEIANEGAIFEEEIMEARASFSRELVALQRTQNRAIY
jgi:hypothetical protein